MLQEGLTDYILDGQTFDLDGVRSIASDPRHVATSPFTSYNYHGKGSFASMIDAVVLGATEVDVNFNGNVVTHSDGRLLHGIGGWQNCLFAGCTILAVPSFRDRIPVIVDEVTTLTGPGEMIDVVVTERGIAINPARAGSDRCGEGLELPIRPIQDIKAEVERICGGKPARPKLRGNPVAVVKWVDGTVLDTVWQVVEILSHGFARINTDKSLTWTSVPARAEWLGLWRWLARAGRSRLHFLAPTFSIRSSWRRSTGRVGNGPLLRRRACLGSYC